MRRRVKEVLGVCCVPAGEFLISDSAGRLAVAGSRTTCVLAV